MARQEIGELVKELVQKGWPLKEKAVRIMASVKRHAEYQSMYRNWLFDVRYPSEPENIHQYRLNNLPDVTKSFFDKVISILEKIRICPDFKIYYTSPSQEEELKYVEDLVFTRLLKFAIIDPNGLYLLNEDFLITSDNIIYLDDGSALFLKDDYFHYLTENGTFLLDRSYKLKFSSKENTLKYIIKLGHIYGSTDENFYESLFQGAVGSWDNALVMYSDVVVGTKQHVFPEKYRFVTEPCQSCSGTGYIEQRDLIDGKESKVYRFQCASCKGTGTPATGVMSEHVITLTNINDSIMGGLKVPVPPVGYIQKDIESMDFIFNAYRQFIKDGLACFSMEFLMESGLNQSGAAKEIDRMELDLFLSKVANYIKVLFERVFAVLTDNVPKVSSPKHFKTIYESDADLLAVKNQVSPELYDTYEMAFIERNVFGMKKDLLILEITLDPLRNFSLDEKINLLERGLIEEYEFYASIYISEIVRKLYSDEFINLDLKTQLNLVYESAQKRSLLSPRASQ